MVAARPNPRSFPSSPSSRTLVHGPSLSALPFLISTMASKLLRQSRLRALCSSHIRSTRFCNTTRATYAFLKFRPFSDASSSPSPEKPQSHCNTKTNTGMERGSTSTSTTPPNPSSLKEPELAKFASIAETWSALNSLGYLPIFKLVFLFCLVGAREDANKKDIETFLLLGGILKGHLNHCMWWIQQDLLSSAPFFVDISGRFCLLSSLR